MSSGLQITMANQGDFLDEDDMASDSATKVASQQSIKAYIANLFYTDVLAIYGNLSTVPASSNYFMQVGLSGAAASAAAIPWSKGGTFKNMSVRISSAQPGTGSLVFTLYVNGSPTSLVVTIAAGSSGPATYSNTANEVTVNDGDTIFVYVTNNATSSSAQIGGLSMQNRQQVHT